MLFLFRYTLFKPDPIFTAIFLQSPLRIPTSLISSSEEVISVNSSYILAHRYRNTICYPVKLMGITCKVCEFCSDFFNCCVQVSTGSIVSQNLGNRSLIFFLQKPKQAFSESIMSNSNKSYGDYFTIAHNRIVDVTAIRNV